MVVENGEISGLSSTDNKLIIRAMLENKKVLLKVLKVLKEIKKVLEKEG